MNLPARARSAALVLFAVIVVVDITAPGAAVVAWVLVAGFAATGAWAGYRAARELRDAFDGFPAGVDLFPCDRARQAQAKTHITALYAPAVCAFVLESTIASPATPGVGAGLFALYLWTIASQPAAVAALAFCYLQDMRDLYQEVE